MSDTAAVRQFIRDHFNEDDFTALAFDFFPNVANDFSAGMTRSRKIQLLLEYASRQPERWQRLLGALERMRPEPYADRLAGLDFAPPSGLDAMPTPIPPAARDPFQIFLSHAHQDAELAHRLATDLKAEGWSIWIAPDAIRPGEMWAEAIDRGLAESGVFVLLLSPAVLRSTWVKRETYAAIELQHRDLVKFIPLRVAECEPPSLWQTYQWLDFTGRYDLALDVLRSHLPARPEPPPEAVRPAAPPAIAGLTPRETEVLTYVAQGLTNRQIAARLGLPLRVVSRSVRQILDKLSLVNRTQAAVFAVQQGLVDKADADQTPAAPPPMPPAVPAGADTSGPVRAETPPAAASFQPVSRVETPPPKQDVPPEHIPGSLVQLDDGRYYHVKTGMEMVFVPAGPFLYGDEKQERELPAFWIGRTPVTNAQYKQFLDANPRQPVPFAEEKWAEMYNWDIMRRTFPDGCADHPVVMVSWQDASAFCRWAGLALPVEEQWEKAARGTDGRTYPWGDGEPAADRCNFYGNVRSITPVNRYSPQGDSPYGCADMAGNVWDWTNSWFDIPDYGRVLRGGSFAHYATDARAANRFLSGDHGTDLAGFRAVENLVPMSAYAAVTPSSRVEAPPARQHVSPELVPDSLVKLYDDRYYHIKTGMEMVYVPAGPFLYGDDKQERTLDAFWIGRTPVTNAQFKSFLDANPDHRVPSEAEEWARGYNWDVPRRAFPDGRADHPAVLISWEDAAAFCSWAGLNLLDEESWEKAARGVDGREYPWGNKMPEAELCNFEESVGVTSPVGRSSPQGDSPYGCVDMAGNVWEWTASDWDAGKGRKVLRGGSWNTEARYVRCAYRFNETLDYRNIIFGFRCQLGRRLLPTT